MPAGRPVRPGDRMPAGRTVRPEGRGPAGGQEARVHVGYAPGRMSDDMTRQIPVGETVRESLYTRDAREYLEKRRQPFRMEDSGNQAQPDRPGNKALRIIVALLVVAGLVLTGYLILKRWNDPERVAAREMPQVINFIVPETEGKVAPTELNFFVETDKNANGIRLRGEDGRDLDTSPVPVSNTDKTLWSLTLTVMTEFDETVTLQVQREEGGEWYDTDKTAKITVPGPPET